MKADTRRSGRRPFWLAMLLAVVALLILNTLLSFNNRPSTIWPAFSPHVSIELLLGIGLLALLAQRGPVARGTLWFLAALVTLGSLLRYLHVTTLGVLGRPFDLNADLPHVGNVASMMSRDLPAGITGLAVVLPVLVIGLVLLISRFSVGALAAMVERQRVRPLALLLAIASGFLFSIVVIVRGEGETKVQAAEWDPWQGRLVDDPAAPGIFATPVTLYAVQQLATLRAANAATLDRLQPATSSFEGLDDENGRPADVLLIFLESYGATLIEDPQHLPYIEDRFQQMAQHLDASGIAYASVQARSPTFGGGSWRAHATLMSGLLLDNEKIYDLLLSSDRPSMPHLLARHGYRTVAAEPGIQKEWPEGDYFRFDRIYDAAGLDYHDKEMGWWKIPDQFTLHAIERRELAAEQRPPVFAKISLIMSHIPYAPIPPVVEDWQRFDQADAFETSLHSVGADDYRDLVELSTRYVAVFRYELDILERFLIERLGENTLVIVSGDHQPPKLATHDSQSWAVPLHVFSRRSELIEGWRAEGFEPTLIPGRSDFAMEDFLPAFCRIYDSKSTPDSPGSSAP